DHAARRSPEQLYRRLVTEAPVLSLGPVWVVSGHTAITRLARHPEVSMNPSVRGVEVPLSPLPTLSALLGRMLAVRDGEDHRRLKRLAVATFSAARIAAARGKLEEGELTAFVLMLFANGLETLTSGISIAVWQLLQHPEHLERLRREPEIAEALFEECLRLGSPVRASSRALTADVELEGTQ